MECMMGNGVYFSPFSAFDPNLTLHDDRAQTLKWYVIGQTGTSIGQMTQLHLSPLSSKHSNIRFKKFLNLNSFKNVFILNNMCVDGLKNYNRMKKEVLKHIIFRVMHKHPQIMTPFK